MLSSEDGVEGFHIVGSVIVYVILVFLISKLISVFLLVNANEGRKSLVKEQTKFVIENIIVPSGFALVIGAILFFAVFFALMLISATIFDINSVIYGVLDRKFFILALLMSSVNSVLIFYLFFNNQSIQTFQQFIDIRQLHYPNSNSVKSPPRTATKKVKKPTTSSSSPQTVTVKGHQFSSIAAACKAYGFNASTVRSRMRSRNISCEDAIMQLTDDE